jgi:hypothetical protein
VSGVQDIVAASVGAASLVATVLLSFIAMRVSRDFGDLGNRVDELKRIVDERLKRDAEISFQAQMVFEVSSDIYKFNSVIGVFLREYSKARELIDTERRLLSILERELKSINRDVDEHMDLLNVLIYANENAIRSLIDKRPNRRTIDFLQRIKYIGKSVPGINLEYEIDRLVRRVTIVDSSRWTGRRI